MPPGGPGGPAGPYGHYSGGAVPPGGNGGGRNRWLIPAAAATAVIVMAGAVWASVSLVNFAGNQPETVLPGNTAMFAKVDLSIDGNQAVELMQFIDQLPDEMAEELDADDGDMNELFADVFSDAFPEASKGSVQEWIGDGVGMGMWPSDDSSVGTEAGVGGAGMAFALSVENERLAEEEFDAISSEYDDLHYEVTDGFVLLTPDSASLGDLERQVDEHGTLDSADDFSSDMSDLPSGSLATAWGDLAAMEEAEVTDEVRAELATGPTEISGRVSAALHIDGSYLQVDSALTDWSVDGSDMTWLADAETGSVEAIGQLPENTVMAFGATGLDSALTEAYDDGELDFLTDNRDFQQMERDLNSVGAHLPEGFGALLGSSTVFGLTGQDSDGFFEETGGEASFMYRAEGGDAQVVEDFVNDLMVGPYGQPPAVSDEDGTVVVQEGSSSTGALADDAVFEQTMQEMDEAVVAGFFDLRQVLAQDNSVQDADQWGAVGFAVTPGEDGNRLSGELRWSPSGGDGED
ncbi:hypothetical protein IDM40_16065 [Nocardiopsis sp. HNM0947]|uniref:DUF3352 domain-containing protein n=2 Tax=Nocardiopsis coralli TaxID=2772213 RepID=A0ABR9P8N1_9ACTN|nr:hypothetical protein [Nocardiopsis coralli]